ESARHTATATGSESSVTRGICCVASASVSPSDDAAEEAGGGGVDRVVCVPARRTGGFCDTVTCHGTEPHRGSRGPVYAAARWLPGHCSGGTGSSAMKLVANNRDGHGNRMPHVQCSARRTSGR